MNRVRDMAQALADYIDAIVAQELHELWSPIGQEDTPMPAHVRARMADAMRDPVVACDALCSLMYKDDAADARAHARIRATLRGEPKP